MHLGPELSQQQELGWQQEQEQGQEQGQGQVRRRRHSTVHLGAAGGVLRLLREEGLGARREEGLGARREEGLVARRQFGRQISLHPSWHRDSLH